MILPPAANLYNRQPLMGAVAGHQGERMNQETRPAPPLQWQQLHLVRVGQRRWHLGLERHTGYVYRNPGWYAMLGYANHSKAIRYSPGRSVIHPKTTPGDGTFRGLHRAAHRALPYRVPLPLPDGSYLWIEDTGYIIEPQRRWLMANARCAPATLTLASAWLRSCNREPITGEPGCRTRTRELSWSTRLQRQLDENWPNAMPDPRRQSLPAGKGLQLECQRAQRFRQPLSLMPWTWMISSRSTTAMARGVTGHWCRWRKTCAAACVILTCWRVGGDEFIIVLPQTALSEALDVATTLRQAVQQLEPVGDCQLTMTATAWYSGAARKTRSSAAGAGGPGATGPGRQATRSQ